MILKNITASPIIPRIAVAITQKYSMMSKIALNNLADLDLSSRSFIFIVPSAKLLQYGYIVSTYMYCAILSHLTYTIT